MDPLSQAINQLLTDPLRPVKNVVPYLDPTNPFYDKIPILKQTREFSRNLGPYDPAMDHSIPFEKRIPMYLQKYGQNFMGGHGNFGKPSPIEINKAAKLMRSNPVGRVNLDDMRVIGKFGELVETGKGRNNLGETGKTIQSLITDLFGSKAKDWTNKQIKVALDEVLKRAMEARRK